MQAREREKTTTGTQFFETTKLVVVLSPHFCSPRLGGVMRWWCWFRGGPFFHPISFLSLCCLCLCCVFAFVFVLFVFVAVFAFVYASSVFLCAVSVFVLY